MIPFLAKGIQDLKDKLKIKWTNDSKFEYIIWMSVSCLLQLWNKLEMILLILFMKKVNLFVCDSFYEICLEIKTVI